MLAYQLKIAAKSLRRNPVLSLLLVAGIGLGVAVSTAFVTTYYMLSSDPIPAKSDRLYYVQLDNWDPARPWDDERPDEPPDQISYRDMVALMESDIPTYQAGMFKAELTLYPPAAAERPYRALTRMTFADFFPMFDVPFLYGGPWSRTADAGPEAVVVLSAETNRRLFGGDDSVGRTLRIEDREFAVVGVLDEWHPSPKFYDVTQFSYAEPEEIYLPFHWNRPLEIYSAGNRSNWKFYAGDAYEDYLASESIWIQMWVELATADDRRRYLDFLDAYIREQQRAGRLLRPVNHRLRPVMEHLEAQRVVPESARLLLIIALLFLVVCSVNLIGILLGKFLARAPEVGVRRALGASKLAVFTQHLVECEVIGVAGGALGLVLSSIGLTLINGLFPSESFHFALDLPMVAAGLVLSLVAGLVAGLYPSWRICRVPPALYLKLQ